MKGFWVVWNPSHGLPRYQHATRHQAEVEAKRLAAANPGQRFVVMGSVGEAITTNVHWQNHQYDQDDFIPF